MELKNISTWKREFSLFFGEFMPYWSRSDAMFQAQDYLKGLLTSHQSKNCWNLAESTHQLGPQGPQRVLRTVKWNESLVKGKMQEIALKHLGEDTERGFIIDESGFPKSGNCSVGVQRQYCGSVGKVTNCQVGVFMGSISSKGFAFLDYRLYLPKSWNQESLRWEKAGIPCETVFKTKPQLAVDMLEELREQAIPINWVATDSVYGNSPLLRAYLFEKTIPFVCGISSTTRLIEESETLVIVESQQGEEFEIQIPCLQSISVTEYQKRFTAHKWRQFEPKSSYQWARSQLNIWDGSELRKVWLLVRRSLKKTNELAYFLCGSSPSVSLKKLSQRASSRWAIEQGFKEAKGETGLGDYQVRGWIAWHRHIVLSLLAYLFLSLLKFQSLTLYQEDDLAPFTVAEIHKLFLFLSPFYAMCSDHPLYWSWWRRKHNHKTIRWYLNHYSLKKVA